MRRNVVKFGCLPAAGLVVAVLFLTAIFGCGRPSSQPAARSSPAAATARFTSRTLLDVSGSGDYTTAKFTVGGDGDYDVDWVYSVRNGLLEVSFDFIGDEGYDYNVTDPAQLGAGGSGVTHVYHDAGTHDLDVSSQGTWTIKVVTAP